MRCCLKAASVQLKQNGPREGRAAPSTQRIPVSHVLYLLASEEHVPRNGSDIIGFSVHIPSVHQEEVTHGMLLGKETAEDGMSIQW